MENGLKRANEIIRALRGNIVAGVSGGMDSMCLIDLIIKSGIDLSRVKVVHIDHNLRQSSGRDKRFVEDFCREKGICCKVFSADIGKMTQISGLSVETQAREYRHEVFKREANGGAILLAHTASDQAETILMHIFRGCGIGGLKGMSERDGQIVRPLINLYREDIAAYIDENRLQFVEDETNADLNYDRNFIRHLLGEIKSRYGGAHKNLNKLSGMIREIEPKLDYSLFKKEGERVILSKSAFLDFNINHYILAALKMAGLRHDFEYKHVSIVKALADRPTGKRINLPHGFVATNEREGIAFGKN